MQKDAKQYAIAFFPTYNIGKKTINYTNHGKTELWLKLHKNLLSTDSHAAKPTIYARLNTLTYTVIYQ